MESQVVNINKQAILKVVENQLELFAGQIIKKNKQIKDLKYELVECQTERIKLAKAYAKKMKVLK